MASSTITSIRVTGLRVMKQHEIEIRYLGGFVEYKHVSHESLRSAATELLSKMTQEEIEQAIAEAKERK